MTETPDARAAVKARDSLRRCPHCEGAIARANKEQPHVVAGTTFLVRAPASQCRRCGAVFMSGTALLEIDLVIAAYLATHGPPSGETLRFMRKALGLRGFAFAKLMGVTGETVSRWENGQRAVDPKIWVVLGSIILEKIRRPAATMRRLLALREGADPAKVVRLDLTRPRARQAPVSVRAKSVA